MSSVEQQREQKQAYLRDNVSMEDYEDFAEFCQNEAGEVDIDKWSFDYVKQLIIKYNSEKQKEEQEQQHQRSFANYQTADIQQAYSIVAAVQNSHHDQIEKGAETGSKEPKPQSMKKKSAFDLLDSVFDEQSSSNNSSPGSNSPPTKLNEQQYQSNSKVSAFDNGNIWATSSNIQTVKKSNDFDNFWDFPQKDSKGSKKEQPFQTDGLNFAIPQHISKKEEKPSTEEVLSYDELTKRLNMQKKSTPLIQEAAEKPSNMKKQPTSFAQVPASKQPQETSNKHIKLISQKPLSSDSTLPQKSPASAYKMNKIPYTGPSVHKQEFKDTIKCYEAVFRPQLNDKNLSITIDKHEIVERNFFVSDYVMYYLTIKPINLVCKRNYEDFTKLRAALEKVYPAVQLPYLDKNSWFETSLENIKKQKTMLQFFINDLIKSPEIRNSRILEDFLTLKEHKAIKRKFEEYAKMDKFKSLDELCVLGGKVEVVVNEKQRVYHEELARFLDSIEDSLDKKRKLVETLADQFGAVNNTLSLLGKLSSSIAEDVKKFNQKVPDHQLLSLENTFSLVSKSYEEWASRVNFESKVVNKRLAPFYRYQKDNINTLRDLHDSHASLFKSYQKRSHYENPHNNENYGLSKLSSYKTGVLEESKNITVLKYQLGYSGNMLCKQSVRFFELMSDSFKSKWIYKAEKYKERLTKDLEFQNSILRLAD